MDTQTLLVYLLQASYFLAAVLFILGIKRMSSPVTARSGISGPASACSSRRSRRSRSPAATISG